MTYVRVNPFATKHFLKQFLFPQFLFIHNFSLQKLTALQKVQNKRAAKLRWLLQINEQSIHTFFSAMGRRLGLLPCLPPIFGKQLPTSP